MACSQLQQWWLESCSAETLVALLARLGFAEMRSRTVAEVLKTDNWRCLKLTPEGVIEVEQRKYLQWDNSGEAWGTYNFVIRCCFKKSEGCAPVIAGAGPRSTRRFVADGSPVSSSLFQTQKPHAQCSQKWVPNPLQTRVMERVAPMCSLIYVVIEKWRKIHSVPLTAGECWSVRFVLSEPNFQYIPTEDEPKVCDSLFIRNSWWNWKRWSSCLVLAVCL